MKYIAESSKLGNSNEWLIFISIFLFLVISTIVIFNFLIVKFSQKIIWYRKFIAWQKGYKYLDDMGIVFQKSFVECGIAALKMVLDILKINATIMELRTIVKFDQTALNMLDIVKIANRKGIQVEGWEINRKDFFAIQCPVMTTLYKKNTHWVVIFKIINDENRVILLDPVLGRVAVNVNRFFKLWSGYVLKFNKTCS